MYQGHRNPPEKFIKEYFDKVLKHIGIDEKSLSTDKNEWDLKTEYIPNHACIWNKIDNIGKRCKIIFKDDKLALVQFKHYTDNENMKNMLSSTYRLEDLIKK